MTFAISSATLRRGLIILAAVTLAACQSVSLAPVAQPPVPVLPVDPIVQPPKLPIPPRVGLALGGGAARSFAHIGVIQVLEENGIKVDLVAGTSAGSLVAALYASGKTPKEMAQIAETMDEGAITDWAFPTRGLIRGDALARFVREKVDGKQIEQMRIPLGIVATDLSTGAGILFRTGDTGVAVRASSSVPLVFQSVRILNRDYVDGGLVAPVPVRYARQMGAEMLIAVDISAPPRDQPGTDAIHTLLQTVAIMGRSINSYELREADVVIRPALNDVGSADFGARMRSIAAGREAALAALPQIRQKIASKTR